MNKQSNYIFKKKKIYKIILYLLLFIIISFLLYFSIPKFFNYSPELIQKSLKKNSDLNIKNILNTSYKFFPSPRLRINGSSLEIEDNILQVKGAEIEIVLNLISLINYKKLNYDRLLIKGGSTSIKINKANLLLDYIKKNKKKIYFKKNSIIVLQDNKKLFKINNSTIKVNLKNNIHQLIIDGRLLNNKISFFLESKPEKKTSIILKIPELDISTNISLKKINTPTSYEGLVNFEILNNFLQFNFIKKKNTAINKGYMRSNLINSTFEGEVYFKPHFFFNLNVEPSRANIEKLLLLVQKNYFSEGSLGLEIIKKMNGILNLKTMFEGNIIFENRKILFNNFKIGIGAPIFLDAKILEFGKKGKIQFSLLKNIQYKKDSTKELVISGFITPSSSEVNFEQVILDKKNFSAKKIKNYEEKFSTEVINNSLGNIFNEKKINSFFKNFIN